jgi:hypothetical protein
VEGLEPELLSSLYTAQGKTLAEIARLLDRSEETVRRAMVAASIPRRRRGYPVGKHLPSGGRIEDADGYVLLRRPEHPLANSGGYVREHRLVMEELLGRKLTKEEVVHHINGQKDDNRPENLQLYRSNAEHKCEDMKGNAWSKGDFGNPKRRYRRVRSLAEQLESIRQLRVTLDRPIRRSDLVPPWVSYRALNRAWGHWTNAVRTALGGNDEDGLWVPKFNQVHPMFGPIWGDEAAA